MRFVFGIIGIVPFLSIAFDRVAIFHNYQWQFYINQLSKYSAIIYHIYYISYFSPIQYHPNMSQDSFQLLVGFIASAVSGTTTHAHKQIYDYIATIETNPTTYMQLLDIITTDDQNVNDSIRKMALIIMKASLKRNAGVVQFTSEEFNYLRKRILELPIYTDRGMQKTKKGLISTITTWDRNVDMVTLEYLISMVNSEEKMWSFCGLETIKIIFEDLKFEIENFQKILSVQFANFMDHFTQSFANKFTQGDSAICTICLQCMNLMIRHLPPNSPIIKTYTEAYLLPLLINKANQSTRMRVQIIEGFIEITQIDPYYIPRNQNALIAILSQPLSQPSQPLAQQQRTQSTAQQIMNDLKKQWLSLLLDLIVADGYEENLLKYIDAILEKVILCMKYTKEDKKEMMIELEEENNPYHYEEQQNGEQEEQFKSNWSYTPRKLSILCFSRLVINHPEAVWQKVSPFIQSLVSNQNQQKIELGCLLVGLIFQNMEDHLQVLQHYLSLFSQSLNEPSVTLQLKCTILWMIGKLSYLIVREPVIHFQIQKQLMKCLNKDNSVIIRNNAYMALDQLTTNSEVLPKLMNQFVTCLVNGIKICSAKSLYSVLKVCATLFERHSQEISDEITSAIIGVLCEKWHSCSQIQSIMCPIVECLVTICSGKPSSFSKYGHQIFVEAAKVIQSADNQKQLVIRIIDLLSSIIALKLPAITQWICSDQDFHSEIVYKKLLSSSQNEVINFTYGLIGDICKCTPINPQFAESYIKIIGQSLMQKEAVAAKSSNVNTNLTYISNNLTCLTDLLTSHPQLALKNQCQYAKQVIQIAVKKLSINNLSKIYAFNFARVYGRLGKLVPEYGARFIRNILMSTCIGLRVSQQSLLTDEAFQGVLKMIMCNPDDSKHRFQFLVDSLICYPCGNPNLTTNFIQILQTFKDSQSQDQWLQFLNKPIFLPATVRKIQSLCSS